MKFKQDMRDMGTDYFGGLFHKNKDENVLWIRTGGGHYVPIGQWYRNSVLFPLVLLLLTVIVYLRVTLF